MLPGEIGHFLQDGVFCYLFTINGMGISTPLFFLCWGMRIHWKKEGQRSYLNFRSASMGDMQVLWLLPMGRSPLGRHTFQFNFENMCGWHPPLTALPADAAFESCSNVDCHKVQRADWLNFRQNEDVRLFLEGFLIGRAPVFLFVCFFNGISSGQEF